MEQQLFVDGVGTITVIGQTVRFDLVALSPTGSDANGKAAPVLAQRVVMTTDGFLASLEKLQNAAEALSRLNVVPAATGPRRVCEAPVEIQAAPSPVVPLPPALRRPFP